MRLIDALTLKLETFIGDDVPAYAILSHTWGSHEVTLQDFRTETLHQGSGYREVLEACRIARTEGYFYVWVDTCCIDKTSSAELCEAINSMFSRYRDSAVCYVYLSDLQPENDLSTALGTCRWFTRGWTPQELIAPANICFYDSSWSAIGTKRNLIAHLCYITGISKEVLRSSDSDDLYCIPVATRLSWASRRTTTRREDIASCLLGIFNVNIPLLYGEGEKAFRQLQEEILRKTSDLSILIWSPPPESSTQPLRGIWARHPQEFSWLLSLYQDIALKVIGHPDVNNTSKGLRLSTALIEYSRALLTDLLADDTSDHFDVLSVGCSFHGYGKHLGHIGIPLTKVDPPWSPRYKFNS